MASKHFKTTLPFIAAIILTLGLSISFQSLLAAYTAPLANPATCITGNPGCDAPLSSSSALVQSTQGALWVVNAAYPASPYGLIVEQGKVGIGIIAPNYKFDVQGGQINSSGGFCIAGDCKTAWNQIIAGSITNQGALATQNSVTDAQVPDSITINYAGSAGTITSQGALATLNAVSGGTITDGTITSADIDNTSIQQRVSGACSSGTSINAINANGTVTCQAGGSGTVTSVTAGTGLSGGIITTSGTIFLDTANANTWTGAQTFSGGINATGGLCINGDCKSSWSQAGATSERIVQIVSRSITWSGYNCSTYPGADSADGDKCSSDLYKCTRDDAINNRVFSDVYGNSGWVAEDLIRCSLEYNGDSGNSIQIEINEPSNTNWECTDYNLQDYCGDEDGCRVVYYGQHKLNDTTRVIEDFIYMEQPVWSSSAGTGLYGFTREDGGEYGWITGDGTGDVIMSPWKWTYVLNYYWDQCGGNQTAFSDPYVFRFATHPHIHSKYIIYDKP